MQDSWIKSATRTLIVGSMVSGCAITPEPLTEAELASSAAERLDRVDAGQEPITGAIDLYEAMARARSAISA